MKANKMTLTFFAVLIAAGVVVIISLRHDYHNIINLFSNMNISWFLVAVGLMIIYNLIDIVFIKYAYSKVKKGYRLVQAFEIQQIGNFFSLIDPFGGSGNAAQPIILKKQGIDVEYSTSVVMLTFISYQTILVILTSIILIFFHNFDISAAMVSLIIIGFLVNFVVIFTLIMASISAKFQNTVISLIGLILGKLKFIKNSENIVKGLDDTFTGFRSNFKKLLKNRKLIIYRLVCDVAKLLVYFSITYFVAKSLNVTIDIHDFISCFVLTSFVYIVSSIIPTPGSIGGAEASFLLIFGSLFHSYTASVMLLWRFLVTYLPMIFGFMVFAITGRQKK